MHVNRRRFLQSSALSASAILTNHLPFVKGISNYNGITAKSNRISSMTGPLDPAKMGVTLMHEHLLFFNGAAPDDPGFQSIPDNLKDSSVNFVSQKLNDAARVGIQTIVDVGPYRPIELYQQIAAKTKVNIIVSTGFYRESTRPPWLVNMTDEDAMVDYMLRDIQEGIGGTKIKAGIIKVAQQKSPMSDWEMKVFLAAARVQKKTGIHIATHTGNALEQFEILTKNGADPKHLYFSHTDVKREGKVGDLVGLLKEGSYVETDTFGQGFYTPESLLVSFIRSVCDAGYSKQLFLSIDSNWHWAKGEIKYEGLEAPHLDKEANNRTFAYMVSDAIPMLLKSGFGLQEINTFLVDNPRRYFSGNF